MTNTPSAVPVRADELETGNQTVPPVSHVSINPVLTGQRCRELLAIAMSDRLSTAASARVDVTIDEPLAPRWRQMGGRRSRGDAPTGGTVWAWLSPLFVTLNSGDADTAATWWWPAHWDPTDVQECEDKAVSPGWHKGLYVGRPLAVGHGVRLIEDLHIIPRPSSPYLHRRLDGSKSRHTWRLDLALMPELGAGTFGDPFKGEARTIERVAEAIAGLPPSQVTLRQRALELIGLPSDTVDVDACEHALLKKCEQVLDEVETSRRNWPSRTAEARNRLFGDEELFAELLLQRLGQLPGRGPRQPMQGWLDQVIVRVADMSDRALRTIKSIGSGTSSVIMPIDYGTSLSRVEQASRVAFLGYRGIGGTVRGRSDLRDLDPAWRGKLCPVQTPESTDVGLVRFAATAGRDDAPSNLTEWFDLSASAALIPFINHDDPARASIGSKNLKQAVPVVGAEAPRIATGWEKTFGLAEGCARAPITGTVTRISDGYIAIESKRDLRQIASGAPWEARSCIANTWKTDVAEGDDVESGQILAHAPDVTVHGKFDAELCLGVNALVALTPWHGFNHEDAMVVSQSFANRMESKHFVRIDEPMKPDEWWDIAVEPSDGVIVGQTLATVYGTVATDDGSKVRSTRVDSPVNGVFHGAMTDRVRNSLSLLLGVSRPLAIGDKLTNRHQGKGVVSQILPDDQMPCLPDGTPVEVLLNPMGVLRRLNIGQLWEMHASLDTYLRGDVSQQVVGRVVADAMTLAQSLDSHGASRGRLRLTLNGQPFGDDDGIVVGWQYLIKLNHLAADKLTVRDGTASLSPINEQPTRTKRYRGGRSIGAAQRIGEMEVWALEASGADVVLGDVLRWRSAPQDWAIGRPKSSLRSVQAHLAVAGLDMVDQDGKLVVLDELTFKDVKQLRCVWREDRSLPQLPHWQSLGRRDKPLNQMDIAAMITAYDRGDPDFAYLGDALYDPATHGKIGESRAEQVLYSLKLPLPVPHPWQKKKMPLLPPLTSIAVLPPAFRIGQPSGSRGIDYFYQKLAIAIQDLNVALQKEKVDPLAIQRVAEWVWTIVGVPEKAVIPGYVAGTDVLERIDAAKKITVTLPKEMRSEGAPGSIEITEVAPGSWQLPTDIDTNALICLLENCDFSKRQGWAKRGTFSKASGPGKADPSSMLLRLSGKRGLLRRSLLGQSVIRSGRSVIVPDFTLRPDQVGLPSTLMDGLNVSSTMLDEFGDVVIVNRQPSLHPYNLVALRATPRDDDAIRLHPLVLTCLAGDFDGDTIAVHRPIDPGVHNEEAGGVPDQPSAQEQALQRMSPQAYLRSSASGGVLAKMDLDIALGLYLASERTPDTLRALGLEFSGALDAKNGLPQAVNRLVRLEQDRTDTLLKLGVLEKAGVDAATGWSIGAIDLLLDGRDGLRMSQALAAGAAGKDTAIVQLLERRGSAATRNSSPGGHPDTAGADVDGSFLTGIAVDDYFMTSPEAITGLAEKKLMSPHAGALTKTLVEIADRVVVVEASCDLPDALRSPLTCRSKGGICQMCYGDDPGLGRPPEIGARVGVLAAILIGERSTQLSMQAFHGGGQAGSLGGSVRDLNAIFGTGSYGGLFGETKIHTVKDKRAPGGTRLVGGKPRNLAGYLMKDGKAGLKRTPRVDLSDPAFVLEVFAPVVARACEILQGKVRATHVQVILRQLLDTYLAGAYYPVGGMQGLAGAAQTRQRSLFEVATERGNVTALLPIFPDGPGSFRTRLIAGDSK